MNKNRVAVNAKWIILCKVIQSLLQLVIGMLSARYLGPANYGIINYAKSVVAFVLPFTQLGLNATLVKELIESPEREGEVLGSALIMSFVSSLLCIASVYASISVLNRGETETIVICILCSLSLLFQSIELIQYWFHSKLQSKYPSIVMLVSYVVVSAYKIYLLVAQKNVYWFAVVYSVEYSVVGISLLCMYFRQSTQGFFFTWDMSKRLLKNSYPYIFSSMMVTIFHNTDHIMLKMLAGNEENGLYSAAVTSASVCTFVYGAIIDSMRPLILLSKKSNTADYEQHISTLYCIITYLAIAQGLFFTFCARYIIIILYGTDYLKSIQVLRLLVWYVIFTQMGRIRNIWVLAESKQSILWKINLIGSITNILLNVALIPRWGAAGAAFASLLTQFFTNFVLGFMLDTIRKNNELMVCGIHPRFLVRLIQNIALKKRRGCNHE